MTQDKGILHPVEARGHFSINRVPFEGRLARYIEHVWIIRWNLPAGELYETEVLPYPAVNIVFQGQASTIAGVGTKKFTRPLKGHGVVIGVLFKPAWAYVFLRRPLGSLTDSYMPLESVWPEYDTDFTAKLLLCSDSEIKVRLERALLAQEPYFDAMVDQMSQIVNRIEQNRSLRKVADVAKLAKVSNRRLEQLFYEYVGMSPKLVIGRFRIQEVADRLHKDPQIRLTDVAHEFGYSDQSHLTRDFQRIIGCTPTEYIRRQLAG